MVAKAPNQFEFSKLDALIIKLRRSVHCAEMLGVSAVAGGGLNWCKLLNGLNVTIGDNKAL